MQCAKKLFSMAPAVGFEPTALRLTAACSTVELRRKLLSIITTQRIKSNYFLQVEQLAVEQVGQEFEEVAAGDTACFSSFAFFLYSSLRYSVV